MAKKENAKRKQRTSARVRRREAKERSAALQRWMQIGGVAVVVVAIAAVAFWPRGGVAASPVDAERMALEPALGPAGADVTIVEYADFGCPSCRAWHHAGIRDRVIETYGDQVRFEWRDFAVITPWSPKAAEAGQCALDQGQDAFWAFHDHVYARGDIREEALISYARSLPIDAAEFEACLNSDRHQATVQRDLDEARDLRLRGTPSFVVGGRVLPGPPTYERLAAIVIAALAR